MGAVSSASHPIGTLHIGTILTFVTLQAQQIPSRKADYACQSSHTCNAIKREQTIKFLRIDVLTSM